MADTKLSIEDLKAQLVQREVELAVINSIQQGIVAQMDLQAIYNLVGDKVRDLFDAQVVAIATFDADMDRESFKYTFEDGKRYYPQSWPIDKIRQRLIKTRRLINISENSEEAFTTITGESPKAIPGTPFPKSMVFVPLTIGDVVKGYVSLQNLDREHAFSDSDIQLLSTLANSMCVALENARLFNKPEQHNAELAVINSVQDGLVREMNMKATYTLVGDPSECLRRVNMMLIPESDLTTFVTVFYGFYNTRTGDVRYSNGGHNLPYVIRADKTIEELKDSDCILLGKIPYIEYDSAKLSLGKGDTLVLFTDGVTEAMNPMGDMYEEGRMESFLSKFENNSCENLTVSLFEDVLKFAKGAEQSDDTTVLTLRRK